MPCHGRPDQSLKWNGKPLPLCARCTAMYGAYLSLPLIGFFPFMHSIILAFCLQLPMMVDGFTQLWKWRESNNGLRVVTGCLSGFGQCLLIWYLADVLFTLLN
ncbi:DUF2085 domain-containing protein [Fictibacillus macauensis]|uniref:DUF2085 domain-containing protein n=1 Tax=Fictibacillus macauensis TaxID=245160 RepID=UPI003B75CD69